MTKKFRNFNFTMN